MNLWVVIDIGGLTVREDPAWAVFTSARWQIAEWPGCADRSGQLPNKTEIDLHRNGITRYVPLYATVQNRHFRSHRPISATLSAARPRSNTGSGGAASAGSRELTAQWLSEWSRIDFVHVASLVATELVEAALARNREPIRASPGN